MSRRSDKILSLAREWDQQTEPTVPLSAVLSGSTLPPVRYAAFGDSNTAGVSNGQSYVAHMDTSKYVRVGGFAQGGFKSTQVAANTTPVDCDVAIIMVGTNDVGPAGWGTPSGDVLAAIRDIVNKSKAPAALIMAVPPRDNGAPSGTAEAQRTLEHNARVKSFVAGMGWTWVDPWWSVRGLDGQWAHQSLTSDGIHPLPVSAERAVRDLVPTLRALTW